MKKNKNQRCKACGLRLPKQGEEWRPGLCICVEYTEVAKVEFDADNLKWPQAGAGHEALVPKQWNPLGVAFVEVGRGSFFVGSDLEAATFWAKGLRQITSEIRLRIGEALPGGVCFVPKEVKGKIIRGSFLAYSNRNAMSVRDLIEAVGKVHIGIDCSRLDTLWCETFES